MPNDLEVLILCGGEGKRLRSMVSDVPKPMAPIGNRPFLDYLINSLAHQGLKNFCFLVGYKSEVIQDYFSQPSDLSIRFSEEKKPLGTGGAIFHAIRTSRFKKFLVLNGDTFFDIDLGEFLSTWKEGTVKLALKEVEDASRYGLVLLGQGGEVKEFIEKGKFSPGSSYINGGIYALRDDVLVYQGTEDSFISLEQEVFPQLLRDKKIFAEPFTSEFIDIGIPEDYIRAQTLIPEWSRRQF
jgi:D-glycero-alpha-D-manno-heptose 1-phosphate guanylyltransferase